MLSFFRSIRLRLLGQASTDTVRKSIIASGAARKYLLYAAGEVLLVMVGILLALQVNNWNENRKAKNAEKELLINFITDLEFDQSIFQDIQEEIIKIRQVYKALYEIGIEDKSNIVIENPNYVRRIMAYDPILNNNLSEMSNKLNNDIIRDEILTYDKEIKLFDVGFLEFRKIVEDRIRVYLGEKGLNRLGNLYRSESIDDINYVEATDLAELSKEVPFQQLLFEAKLKLEVLDLRLEDLLLRNRHLKETIQRELKSY